MRPRDMHKPVMGCGFGTIFGMVLLLLLGLWVGGELWFRWKADRIRGDIREAGGDAVVGTKYWGTVHVGGTDKEAIPTLQILIKYGIPRQLRFDDSRQIDFTLMDADQPWRVGITDESMKYVDQMIWLESLYLGGSRISDGGLKQLAGLNRLHRLVLTSTLVTDEGLRHLSELKSLEYILLGGTPVTADGLEWLMRHNSSLNNGIMQDRLQEMRQREEQQQNGSGRNEAEPPASARTGGSAPKTPLRPQPRRP